MLNDNYILVAKLPKEKTEGFEAVEVEDSSVYSGIVVKLPKRPVYMGNEHVKLGDKVIFAKYSPDTHLITRDGEELKYINTNDLLERCD